MKKHLLILSSIIAGGAMAANQVQPVAPMAASTVAATHDVTMMGDAEVQWAKTSGQNGGFLLSDFAPIFLYRANDDILFEVGFDSMLQNSDGGGASSSFDLSFAQLDYLINDYATLCAGYMVLPLGTYVERGAGWLNKLPDDPLPRGVLPDAGAGVQLRGAFALDNSGQALTYAVYAVNGPSSIDGTGNGSQTNGDPNLDLGGNVGIRSDGSSGNLHGSLSEGGRIGWFMPFKPHYDVELGLSGQSGTWNSDGPHKSWSAEVADAAVHISSAFEVKGEYIHTSQETADQGSLTPHGWWIQGAYKLAGLEIELPYINSFELVGRYDTSNDGVGTHVDRTTAGITYYFTNTLTLEGAYEWLSSNDPAQANDQTVVQLAYGF